MPPPSSNSSSLVRNALVFLFFSATSFFHGVALHYLLYRVLPLPAFLCGLAAYLVLVLMSGAERSGGWTWPAFRDGVTTRSALEYFNATVVGHEKLASAQGERLLFGLHPHGIYPMAGVLFYAGASPLRVAHPWLRIRPCAASVLFRVPLIREYLLWTGHLDASKKTLEKHMRAGADDLALVVGGEKEALATRNGQEKILLLGRTGFVRLALTHGYHLVPTYRRASAHAAHPSPQSLLVHAAALASPPRPTPSPRSFGQNELYTVNQGLLAGARGWVQKKFKVSVPLFWGRCGGPMPHAARLTLAVGEPIRMPAPAVGGAEPPPELVAKVHAEYVAAVRSLFERHKAGAGYADRTLEVVSATARERPSSGEWVQVESPSKRKPKAE